MPPIIEVQNLSKKYKIGATQPRYLSLRDSLSGTFKRVQNLTTFKKLSNLETNTEFWALKDINFEVNAGESIGIIGRNGAGKSTLLKILSRITPPTSGGAILRGRLASLLEVGTGFHPELTGRENVYFNGSILGLRKTEIDRKFDEIVDFSGVERFIDTPLKNYSSGMQLRLAFAVAAHLEPEILIIDEVLAVGDSSFQQKCLGKMQEISTSGNRTIIFVSHNLTAVKQLCNSALLLENGQLIQQGSVASVIQAYNNMSILKGKTIELNTVIRNGNYAQGIVFSRLVFEKEIFEFGEKIGFTLTISKNKPINALDVEFGINISDFNSNQIIHMSNAITHQIFSFSEEKTTKNFYFETETNGLRIGKYRISLFLRVNGIIQDWLRDVAEFDIADGNPYNYNNTNFIQGLIMPIFTIKSV